MSWRIITQMSYAPMSRLEHLGVGRAGDIISNLYSVSILSCYIFRIQRVTPGQLTVRNSNQDSCEQDHQPKNNQVNYIIPELGSSNEHDFSNERYNFATLWHLPRTTMYRSFLHISPCLRVLACWLTRQHFLQVTPLFLQLAVTFGSVCGDLTS